MLGERGDWMWIFLDRRTWLLGDLVETAVTGRGVMVLN